MLPFSINTMDSDFHRPVLFDVDEDVDRFRIHLDEEYDMTHKAADPEAYEDFLSAVDDNRRRLDTVFEDALVQRGHLCMDIENKVSLT